MSSRLSVVVIARGAPEGVVRAVESVREQIGESQLLVAGDLEGQPALREALVPFEGEFQAIQGKTPGEARNAAHAEARGPYLLVVDAHERVASEALSRHIESLDGDSQLIASYGRTAVHEGGRVRVRPERGKGGPVFRRILKDKYLISSSAALVWRLDALGQAPFNADYLCSAALRLDLSVKLSQKGGSFVFHPAVVAERAGEKIDVSGLEEHVKILLGVLYSAEALDEKLEARARFRLARHLVAIGKRHYRAEDFRRAGKFFDEAVKIAPGYFKGRRYQFLNFIKNTITR